MSDLVITPSALSPAPGQPTQNRLAGETITAGQVVFLFSDRTVHIAHANVTGKQTVLGIALNGGTTGQNIVVQIGGTLTLGSGVTKDVIYVLSGDAGGIAPSTDMTTGWAIDILGVGSSTSQIDLNIFNSGIIHS